MKVPLYVMGVYKGEIEVGENSIIGLLARGLFFEALSKTRDLQEEIDQLSGGTHGTIRTEENNRSRHSRGPRQPAD